MWRTARQFCLVLYLVVSHSVVCHALSSQFPNDGLRKVTNIVETPAISNVKSKLILSNGSSTGKPAIVTLSSYSTFSNWDSRTTIQTNNPNQNVGDIIKEAYNKPVIFTTLTTPSKLSNTTTKKTGISVRNPITSLNARIPSEVKPCQRILAGSLCEDDADYPEDAARTLSRDEKFKSRYALYFASESNKKSSKDEVNTRFDPNFSPTSEGTPLCPTQDNLRVFRPTKLRDRNDEWKYILQHGGDNFTQVIQIEICANTDGPCDLLSTLSTAYRSQCVQKYSFRKLVWVFNDKTHGVDEFRVPSCCSCRYFPIGTDNPPVMRLAANKQNKSGA